MLEIEVIKETLTKMGYSMGILSVCGMLYIVLLCILFVYNIILLIFQK